MGYYYDRFALPDSFDVTDLEDALFDYEADEEASIPHDDLDREWADEARALLERYQDMGVVFANQGTFDLVEYAKDKALEYHGVYPDEWPGSFVDWEAAAEALVENYDRVAFLGEDYIVLDEG